MPYITREDGQHFVIPSYRDISTVKQKSQLKKEILLLSKSYGEYITLQKKTATQYEITFSPDTGYLLGETVWHQFKKPADLIYCEAIPNTTEAILVIVKSGSVYLDGSFPVDSIPEELIIFLTQQNNFEIYIYGNVPISKEAAADKFSFEPASVKSFTVLDKPVFPQLPLLKIYQLKSVNVVLREQGIGELPLKQLAMLLAMIGAAWFLWSWYTSKPPPPPPEQVVNPFQAFLDRLTSPAADDEILKLSEVIKVLLQISGWFIVDINYSSGSVSSTVLSMGGSMEDLYTWASAHKATATISPSGIVISMPIQTVNRPTPTIIYSTQKVLAAIIDRMARVLPGNTIKLDPFNRGNVFTQSSMRVDLVAVSPAVLGLIGKQFAGLPVALNGVKATIDDDGNLTGSISIDALGS